MVAIVRPDLYCAGVASADDAEQMITLFVAALGLESVSGVAQLLN